MDRKAKLTKKYLKSIISEEIEIYERDAQEFGRDAATSSILKAKKEAKKGLKSLPKDDLKKMLQVIKVMADAEVLNPKYFRKLVSDAIKGHNEDISSEEDKKEFAKEVAPNIAKIRNEIVKILSGDFSNLVKESKEAVTIHPITYNIIKTLAESSEVNKEQENV